MTFVILVFVGFLSLMNFQFSEAEEKKDYTLMNDLADSIKNEAFMATKVQYNYIRKFEIPYTLNGKDYLIDLNKDSLTITNEENRSVTVVLSVEVKGGFIDKNRLGELEHCITKSELDGIRISRNQASIEPNITSDLRDIDNDGILEIESGKEFDVYVRLNCLEDIHMVKFSLELENLDYKRYELLYQYDDYGVLQTQFENPFFWKKPNDSLIIVNWNNPILDFSIPQVQGRTSSGSGNIIKLRLKSTYPGIAKVKFVSEQLELFDITYTKLSKEALPYSYIDLNIEVI